MMVLINNLPRNVSKKTVVDYFASLSVMVQSVEFRMESDETMSCVVGFWNLDDVDDVVNQASSKDGTVFIGGKPAFCPSPSLGKYARRCSIVNTIGPGTLWI
ncbi:hypothetical protein OS493_016653 [Desmophyllum pertusum]|uniref:RRM domain-containing protein n=1 Tax=Desmophyllum pertusum TaxID=174260 RepID=A0A9W9ZDB9_9CNID|nr:hypothetical protein OS493_016653 [Desmophyllum pertusum]